MAAMRFPLMIVLVIALVLGYLSLFTVDEREKAIMFRLGEIVRSDFEPGLHFQLPIVNNVRKFDSRVLTLDSRPEQILTGEKKNVLIDYYVKWRIEQVEDYYRAFSGRESDAVSRMAQTIKDGLQAELGNRTIREVVSDERTQIMQNVATKADEKMAPFGIDIIDVRIKQIELPPNVATSVFDRMRAERERIAKEHRAEGEKAARIIRARADRQRTELLADSRRQAEEIRGAGDAQATQIYADAFSQDEDFFDFYRSMQAYRESFASKQDILLLQPDSEFFQYFSGSAQGR